MPDLFNEVTLREAIVGVWGPAGAHVDVYDHVLKLARESHADRRSWASIAGDLWNQLENLRGLWEGTEHEAMVQMYIDEYERKDGIRA